MKKWLEEFGGELKTWKWNGSYDQKEKDHPGEGPDWSYSHLLFFSECSLVQLFLLLLC